MIQQLAVKMIVISCRRRIMLFGYGRGRRLGLGGDP
jgi:hypothetical protein